MKSPNCRTSGIPEMTNASMPAAVAAAASPVEGRGRRAGGGKAEVFELRQVAAARCAPDDVDDVTHLLKRRVTVEPDADDRVLRVRQRPRPERPHLLAIRLQQNALDERGVVDGRHA